MMNYMASLMTIKTKVINLFGGPSSGKSTAAAGIFNRMKVKGINAELVMEAAKDHVWEGHTNILSDQLYLLAHQNRRLERLRGQVDYIITDSPLPLCLIYKPKGYLKTFDSLTMELYNTYDNVNFFLKRVDSFQDEGRVHNKTQSLSIDRRIKGILDWSEAPYDVIQVETFSETAIDLMVDKLVE